MSEVLRILAPGVATFKEVASPYIDSNIDQVEEVLPKTSSEALPVTSNKYTLGLNEYRAVVNKLRERLKGQEGNAYVFDKVNKFPELTPYEEQVQESLKSVSDMLGRAYGRRTGMFAWGLLLLLKFYGFEKDNYKPVEKILEEDPDFIKQYAKYYSLIQSGQKEKANEYLESNFNRDEKKQNLAKLAGFVMNTCNKLPSNLLLVFPIAFSVQNLVVPFFARLVKTGPIGKLFDFMRLINPWISEFIAEPMGLYKKEIDTVKKGLPKEDIGGNRIETPLEDSNEPTNSDRIEAIKVTNLTEQEYRLQKIVGKVNSAFDRLFGRKTTLSSWLLTALLKLSPQKYDSYQEFANRFADNPQFIKKLYGYLIEVKALKEKGDLLAKEEVRLFKEKFTGLEERTIARIAYIVISLANYVPDWLIYKAPKYFGLPYSFQNLFMPIITKFVKEESFFGKLLAVIRDVNPIINDLIFDPASTFEEEIRSVRQESESIKDLLPKLVKEESMPKVLDKLFSHAKTFITSIRDFVKNKVVPKGSVKTEVSPA